MAVLLEGASTQYPLAACFSVSLRSVCGEMAARQSEYDPPPDAFTASQSAIVRRRSADRGKPEEHKRIEFGFACAVHSMMC